MHLRRYSRLVDRSLLNKRVSVAHIQCAPTEITGRNPDDSTIEVELPKGKACKRTPILTPYEKMLGQYTDDDIKMMNSVYDYIMNKNPEKDFGDEMWIHNCYNEDLSMRSHGP